MPIAKLRKFLDEKKIKYVVINHSTAYTAQEVAQAAHISGKEIAKTIIVRANGQTAMVVLPGSRKINFDLLKEAVDTESVRLATEDEFREMFPDCETGAMPPFGNLYLIDVYVDRKLAGDSEIAFNAGNHRQLIKMKYKDYERLVKPVLYDLALTVSNRSSINRN